MENGIGATLEELFVELEDIHENLNTALSMLAMLQKAADSPEMADALGFLVSHLRGSTHDVGILAQYGKRRVTEAG